MHLVLLCSLALLAGISAGYFFFKKEKLDSRKVYVIVLKIFGLAAAVCVLYLCSHWYSTYVDHLSESASDILIYVACFIIGIALYLIYYICRRLGSLKKILLLGCIGFAGAIALFWGIGVVDGFVDRHFGPSWVRNWSYIVAEKMQSLSNKYSGVHQSAYGREGLMTAYLEKWRTDFDKDYMIDIAPNLDYVCQLETDKKLGDTLQTVIREIKELLEKERFENLGWQEGTEIYVKRKRGTVQRVFQFIDEDTETPTLRYSSGTFSPEVKTLQATGKREAPPKSKRPAKSKATVTPSSSPSGSGKAGSKKNSDGIPADVIVSHDGMYGKKRIGRFYYVGPGLMGTVIHSVHLNMENGYYTVWINDCFGTHKLKEETPTSFIFEGSAPGIKNGYYGMVETTITISKDWERIVMTNGEALTLEVTKEYFDKCNKAYQQMIGYGIATGQINLNQNTESEVAKQLKEEIEESQRKIDGINNKSIDTYEKRNEVNRGHRTIRYNSTNTSSTPSVWCSICNRYDKPHTHPVNDGRH